MLFRSQELSEACAEVRALVLERQGALRLLRAANALLKGDTGYTALEPLRELRLELAGRCVGLALHLVLADPQGRVRAAGLEACVRSSPAKREELLRWALVGPMPDLPERDELTLRALELIASNGLPPAPAGQDSATREQGWVALLLQAATPLSAEVLALSPGRVELSAVDDGRITLAACRALARVTGRPTSLRPEVWMAWWRESSPGPARQPVEENQP